MYPQGITYERLKPTPLREFFVYKTAFLLAFFALPLPTENKNCSFSNSFDMSGALKEVRNRIKSVQSTQQITKAMKMVSAAKLRRAQDAITQMRPYAHKLQEMLSNIVSNSDGDINLALAAERPVEKVLVIIVTSDRGLCGGYNSNLIKLTKQVISDKYPAQQAKGNVEVLPIGKKGYEHFTKNGFKVVDKYWDIFTGLSFDKVQNGRRICHGKICQ